MKTHKKKSTITSNDGYIINGIYSQINGCLKVPYKFTLHFNSNLILRDLLISWQQIPARVNNPMLLNVFIWLLLVLLIDSIADYGYSHHSVITCIDNVHVKCRLQMLGHRRFHKKCWRSMTSDQLLS